MLRALLVHNANAGTHPLSRAEIEAVLRDAAIEPLYCAHGEDDLAEALQTTVDLVIAAGGDGTVADVVSTLDRTAIPIGILPLGGSNNIANAAGVDGEWRAIPRAWNINRWRRLDRCEADGPWGHQTFVEALGSGVLSEAFDQADDTPDTAEEKERNGRAAFRKALAEAVAFDCAIETAEWRWSGPCLMVELMNIAFVGSHLALAQGAEPGDGLLDIVLVRPEDRDIVLRWAECPDDGPFPIATRRTPAASLTVNDRHIRLDDRSPDEALSGRVDVRIRPNWVKILVPQEACT
ncbi:diacylglycerol/lipid kinase family protein [Sphingomonas montanisoli]|uniref:Diacylglycerol kinase n=1 Tax=Sphingomonas montanisoli TaxID=2606412 RepID=A0A5D9CF14_9SPHN|nr:diacylglycerol kinase family protein [Sphingomonas montanisoli]TZG29590.1 diacylglycerol kinase [Sphingomonas montanisoli]